MLEDTSCSTFASSVASSRFLLRLLSEILQTADMSVLVNRAAPWPVLTPQLAASSYNVMYTARSLCHKTPCMPCVNGCVLVSGLIALSAATSPS